MPGTVEELRALVATRLAAKKEARDRELVELDSNVKSAADERVAELTEAQRQRADAQQRARDEDDALRAAAREAEAERARNAQQDAALRAERERSEALAAAAQRAAEAAVAAAAALQAVDAKFGARVARSEEKLGTLDASVSGIARRMDDTESSLGRVESSSSEMNGKLDRLLAGMLAGGGATAAAAPAPRSTPYPQRDDDEPPALHFNAAAGGGRGERDRDRDRRGDDARERRGDGRRGDVNLGSPRLFSHNGPDALSSAPHLFPWSCIATAYATRDPAPEPDSHSRNLSLASITRRAAAYGALRGLPAAALHRFNPALLAAAMSIAEPALCFLSLTPVYGVVNGASLPSGATVAAALCLLNPAAAVSIANPALFNLTLGASNGVLCVLCSLPAACVAGTGNIRAVYPRAT
eukprot:gene12392-10468_t